jgi:glycosyltransferase involved in cell wall biosynthesis
VSILHIPDPQLAWWLHSSPGNNRIPVIYKDGLLLGPDWNWRFNHVQVLAPYYLAQAQSNGVQTAGWRVIPHFVDVKRFRSAQEEVIGEEPNRIVAVNTSGTVNEKVRELRRNAPGGGLPEDAWLVLAVGDVAVRSAKRLDWVVDEVARCTGPNAPHLVVAGNAEQQDRDRFEARARSRLGERFHFRPRIPPSDMPRLYASVDAMAHAALREPFGLVLIEAMACGVPVVGHKFPVTEWILGDGGRVVDMEECGALAKALMEWQSDTPQHRTFSQAARRRASETFAPRKWIPEYHRWYREISSTGKMS